MIIIVFLVETIIVNNSDGDVSMAQTDGLFISTAAPIEALQSERSANGSSQHRVHRL